MKKTQYHIWLFLFGVLFYLIVPAFVIASRIWKDYPGMDNLYSYYKDEYLLGYFILVSIIVIPFFIGAYLPIYYFKERTSQIHEITISSRGLVFISLPLLLYCQYVIWTNWSYMFQGYMVDIDAPFIGTLATMNMIVLFFFLYNRNGTYSKLSNRIFSLVLLELSVVSLGLGTRMYAMVSVFSIFIFILDQKITSIRKILIWLSVIIVLVLAVGIWRIGETFTLEQMAYIGVAEPTFTWISAISMYDLNDLPLLSYPANFLSSFINLIPSSVLPDKKDLIVELSLKYDAPLGATSVLASLISNFGILGSGVAMFLLGFMMSQMRLRWKTVFGQTYYYCVCGIIPFQLFRDDMGIVNKQFFSNFLLVPMLIFLVHRFLSLLATKIE